MGTAATWRILIFVLGIFYLIPFFVYIGMAILLPQVETPEEAKRVRQANQRGLISSWLGTSAHILRRQSESWTDKHRGRVCSYADKHGLIESIGVREEKHQNELELRLKVLESSEYEVFFKSIALPLSKLPLREQNFARTVRKKLKSLRVEFANEISVEYQAMRSAEGWMNELHWSREALKTLTQIDTDLKATLQMAPGNKLLESSIPAMEDAQKRTQSEYMEVKKVMNEATDVLRQLVEFLSVPASIRGVLSFDETYFYNSEQHDELRQSFDDVVLLNNVYRDLCSQRII